MRVVPSGVCQGDAVEIGGAWILLESDVAVGASDSPSGLEQSQWDCSHVATRSQLVLARLSQSGLPEKWRLEEILQKPVSQAVQLGCLKCRSYSNVERTLSAKGTPATGRAVKL